MADVHSVETRSYNMSRIRSRDTKPEMQVRKFLFLRGFRYRLHDKRLPGRPDIVLPKYKTILFINGCFWHGHEGCRYFVVPKTRTEWWINKIDTNRGKDAAAVIKLQDAGWNIITIWECDLKKNNFEQTLNTLITRLKG
ncbi:very short patch repair endonuclease [Mucilaginibacter sp. R-33]|uniref:very short patch repair endonuclease n=1 Tax=Mucilaginibacter sp. R-33 TaxID=3416711 RepID=UPI003CEAE9C2